MKQLMLLVLLSGSLTSCSRISIVTRYADTFLWWEVNRLVDFSGDKKKIAKAEVEKMYRLATTKSFPVLANSFLKLPDQVNSGKPLDQLPCVEDFIKVISTVPQTLRPSAEILTTLLGQREFENLVNNYRKKIEQENEKMPEQRKDQGSFYQDIVEFFVGGLTDDQEKLIKDFFTEESYPYELQIKNKKHYLQLVEGTKGAPEKLRTLAMEFFIADSKLELEEFKQARNRYFTKISALTNKILISLNEKQKKELRENSLALSADLNSMIATN